MTMNNFNKTIAQISKRPFYFLNIAVLDIVFASAYAAISVLFWKAIVEQASMMIISMQEASGADVAQKIIASTPDVSQYAMNSLKLMLAYAAVSLALFIMLFGFTSFLIARTKQKKMGFLRYIKQYAIISAILAMISIAISIFLGNLVAGIVLSGFQIYHLFEILLMAIIFSTAVYASAVAYASIPEKSPFALLKKAFKESFSNPKHKMMPLLILLLVLLAIIFIIKYGAAFNPALGLFLLILLLFPYLVFARLFFIEVVKR